MASHGISSGFGQSSGGSGGGKGGGGDPGSPKEPVASTYQHLTFIVQIDAIFPDFTEQPAQFSKPGNWWMPPTRKKAYDTGSEYRFYWRAGSMSRLTESSQLGRFKEEKLEQYRAATVFTQRPDSSNLLAVNFDARATHVSSYSLGWQRLSFEHRTKEGADTTFSYLKTLGVEAQLAAPGPTTQIPQLLPGIYNYQPATTPEGIIIPPKTDHAGLIGRLPLLLALPVFSAPPGGLSSVVEQCVKPRSWRPHKYQYPTGHEQYRGVVVTIYFDPTNPDYSTKENLDNLQNGLFGAFYGP